MFKRGESVSLVDRETASLIHSLVLKQADFYEEEISNRANLTRDFDPEPAEGFIFTGRGHWNHYTRCFGSVGYYRD